MFNSSRKAHYRQNEAATAPLCGSMIPRNNLFRQSLYICSILLLIVGLPGCTGKEKKADGPTASVRAPRIINIVNFIRQTDYRLENSDSLLFDTVEQQIRQVNRYDLPATFLLQYDALINPAYQELLKTQLNKHSEIGAWFEITQPQVEDAGMQWKGDYSWDPQANIAFSTGYTPEEREKLVDTYMKKFKEIFGEYPESVGSWYIDAHSLQYMYEKYDIKASCNCKDQIGTDGYTLWGGYWNQAYYPSRLNGYMPAQTAELQIPVPVFRMLGSDPIYQYENGLGSEIQGVVTLEPASGDGGCNRSWVNYFFRSIIEQPCLAFNYAQAGQENSFTWEGMKEGLEIQIPLIDSLRSIEGVRVETLAASGKWFKEKYPSTPATAVTALEDVLNLNNKTVWYNSKYYRANLLWKNKSFYFRDIHLFDERFKSDYVDKAGNGSCFYFYTLPLVDGYCWSTQEDHAGLQLVRHLHSGKNEPIQLLAPTVTEKDSRTLEVICEDTARHLFRITCSEKGMEVACESEDKDFVWSLDLHTTGNMELPFKAVSADEMKAEFKGFAYSIRSRAGEIKVKQNGGYSLVPAKNRIQIDCSNNR